MTNLNRKKNCPEAIRIIVKGCVVCWCHRSKLETFFEIMQIQKHIGAVKAILKQASYTLY